MSDISTEQLQAMISTAAKATPGPWFPGHLGGPGKCQCTSILSETGICGAVASVHVDNGLKISDGGNDAPPKQEAIANMHHIAGCDPDTVTAMAQEIIRLRRSAGEEA